VTLGNGTEVACSFKLVRENDAWKLVSYNIGAGGDWPSSGTTVSVARWPGRVSGRLWIAASHAVVAYRW